MPPSASASAIAPSAEPWRHVDIESLTPQHAHVQIATAAQYFDIDQGTIRRWIRDGRLPAYRLGPRMLRVRMEDVAAMLQPLVIGGAQG